MNPTPPHAADDATGPPRPATSGPARSDEPAPLRRTLVIVVLGAVVILAALITLLWRPLVGALPASSTPTVGIAPSGIATCCSAIPDQTAQGP